MINSGYPTAQNFFVYSVDRRHHIGAFTSANNKGDKDDIQGFATGLVYGDQVILEYWLPNDAKDIGVISIAYVVHGYRYIVLPDNESGGYGQSLDCHININCTQGQNWQNEKNAVAMILVNGDRHCSGALINTTENDNTPLFLTANHCLNGENADSRPFLNWWSFYWHYESPTCTDDVPTTLSTNGAWLEANNKDSDFALLQLYEDPRNAVGVTPYYLGWDRSVTGASSAVGIHHPKGDIKKISLTYQIFNQIQSFGWQGVIYLPDSYWKVTYTYGNGATESGSSGSPLIDSNSRRIIGQLLGGDEGCPAVATPIVKYYGKISASWEGTKRNSLRYWLAPDQNYPPDGIDGIGVPTPTINGPCEICYDGNTYELLHSPIGKKTWTLSGPFVFSNGFQTITGNYPAVHRTLEICNDEGMLMVSIGGTVLDSMVITPCSPASISGIRNGVCYAGTTFELEPDPSPLGTITWTLTGPFAFSNGSQTSTGSYLTVYKSSDIGSKGSLKASIGGTVLDSITITPCPPTKISGDDEVCTTPIKFTLENKPQGTVYWSVSDPNLFTVNPATGNPTYVTSKGKGVGSAILMAVVGSDTITKNITRCLPEPEIIGSDIVCSSVTYSISTGASATWTVPSGFSANTLNGSSITVSANINNYASGTLKAVVNGVTFTKVIKTCWLYIDGPNKFCSTAIYTISGLPSNFSDSVVWTVKSKYYTPSVEPYNPHGIILSLLLVDGWEADIYDLTATIKNSSGVTISKCTHQAYGGILNMIAGKLYWTTASGQSGYFGMNVYDKINVSPWGASDIVDIHSYTSAVGTVYYPDIKDAYAYFWSGCYDAEVDVSILGNQLYITIPSDCEGCEGEIWVNFYEDCGWGEDFYIPFKVLASSSSSSPPPSSTLSYPNPVSDILYIDIEQYMIENANVVGRSQQTPNYDIRLYDGQGNLLRQTFAQDGSVQFNVSNLSNGVYYLHIYNGVRKTPEMQQIIVQH